MENKKGSKKYGLLVIALIAVALVGFYVASAADVLATVDPTVTGYEDGVYEQFNFTVTNNDSAHNITKVVINSTDYTLDCSGATKPANWKLVGGGSSDECEFIADGVGDFIVDGGSENFVMPALTPSVTGTYNWTIDAQREDWSWVSTIVQTQVDAEAPGIPMADLPSDWLNAGDHTVNGSFTGGDLDYCQYKLSDNGTGAGWQWLNCSESFEFDINVPGNCSTNGADTCGLQIFANDSVGNENSTTWQFGVDQTSPTTPVLVELPEFTVVEEVDINVTVTDTYSGMYKVKVWYCNETDYALDNWHSYSWFNAENGSFIISPSLGAKIKQGLHYFKILSKDNAGNLGDNSSVVSTTIDSFAPEIETFDVDSLTVSVPVNAWTPATGIEWVEDEFVVNVNSTDNGTGFDYCELYYTSGYYLEPYLLYEFYADDLGEETSVFMSDADVPDVTLEQLLYAANYTYGHESGIAPQRLSLVCYDIAGGSATTTYALAEMDFDGNGSIGENETYNMLGYDDSVPVMTSEPLENKVYYLSDDSDGIELMLCDDSGVDLDETSFSMDGDDVSLEDEEVSFDDDGELCYTFTIDDEDITTKEYDWELATEDFFENVVTASGDLDVRREVTVSLSEGWNLISSPLRLEDSDISEVLDGMGNVTVMTWDPDSGTYLSYLQIVYEEYTLGGGNMFAIEDGKGYWIYVYEDSELVLRGTDPRISEGGEDPPGLTAYALTGDAWNLIGVSGLYENGIVNVSTYLNAMAGSYPEVSLQTWVNGMYIADVDGSGTPVVRLYRGYWVYMDEDDYLVVPGI